MKYIKKEKDRILLVNFQLFICHHTIVAGYYDFMLDFRVSVHPSVVSPSSIHLSIFRFRMIT